MIGSVQMILLSLAPPKNHLKSGVQPLPKHKGGG